MSARACLALAVMLSLLALPAAAAATPTISEFRSGLDGGSQPFGIALGPDGNLWFTDQGSTPAIGRVTASGAIHEFGIPSGRKPFGIAAGPDGNLWFAEQGSSPAIGRITPAGTITEFTPAGLKSRPTGVAAGPDGNLWFTEQATSPAIGRMNTGGALLDQFPLGTGSKPVGIAAGPDGNLWFADAGTHPAIGRISTAGALDEFPLGAGSVPSEIASGPDGNLWFTDQGATPAIGKVSTSGAITGSGLGSGSAPEGIAGGPDGALWFADHGSPPAIGRSTTTGSIAEFSAGLNGGSAPWDIAAGPDGNMWFTDSGTTPAIGQITTPPTAVTLSASATGANTAAVLGLADGHSQRTSFHIEYGIPGGSTASTREQNLGTINGPSHFAGVIRGLRARTTYQARIVVTNQTDRTAGAFLTFTTLPPKDRITHLRIRPRTFVAAARGATIAPARRAGALVAYTGTQPATTTFRVLRPALGRRVGSACVKPTRRNIGRSPCTRWVNVGNFRHRDVRGANRFRFRGRVRNRTLAPGKYRLSATPRNVGGIGRTVYVSFFIKKR